MAKFYAEYKFLISLLILAVVSYKVCSQNYKLDSLKCKLEEDSIKIFSVKKFLPILIFDTRNSVISSAKINIIGMQAGIVFWERDIAGIGGYKIRLPFRIEGNTNVYLLRVFYFTAFYQKVILDKRYHEIDIMGEAGLGQFTTHKEVNGQEEFVKKGSFNPLGLSAVYTLKPLKWLGIQTMGGYRWMIQKSFRETFSAPFYSVGLWLSVKDLIRAIRYNLICKQRYKKEIQKY